MGNGAAIAIGVGAVALVFFLTKRQESQTAAMLIKQSAPKPTGPYALSISDQLTVGATILGTYFGGPSTGAKIAGTFAS